jgi:hypothetical protein
MQNTDQPPAELRPGWHRYFITLFDITSFQHNKENNMVIEIVAFFIWVFIVLLSAAIAVVRTKKKPALQGTDNVTAKLTFPQRNWLPLCIVIALVSPLAVSGFKVLTRKNPERMPVQRNGAVYQNDDTTRKDTSYHVATPPQQ